MNLARDDLSQAEQHERFVQLFSRFHRRVHAYIGSLLPNVDDAEEVMQETSLVLWRKWDQFEPSADFARWACGIAHFEVLRHRRQQKNRRLRFEFSEHVLDRIAAEHEAQAPLHERREHALSRCLERLSATDRQLIECRYQGKATSREVAHRLRRPEDSVYKALSRIRARLSQCIELSLAREEHA